MARITRSAKDLWSLVSGSSVLNCKELVEYELQENGDRIINGILFFKKVSPQSLDSLKKSVEEIYFEFVSKLSKLIIFGNCCEELYKVRNDEFLLGYGNVDAVQCYELFVSYTTYEFKGTQKTLEAHLGNERHVQSLLLEVWHYYFGERLYYLLILKHILGHWQDETDQYKDIYEKFLDKHNKDNAVVNKLINQMEASINSELPTKDTHGVYMTDLLAYHWVTFVLKEQGELLQLMLLYYKVIEPSINDVQRMFSLFQSHGFGLRQSFRIMLSDDTQSLINHIGYLESFVIIQCFEFDWLFKCKESGMIGEHYLLKNEKALRILNDSILALGSHQSHSPIMLAWLLVAQCSEFPDLLVHCNKLGKTALQLDVFNYLISALNSSVFSGVGQVVSDVANNVVYSLLSCVLSQFDLQHLGSLQPLFTIAGTVLQYPSIADDFWKKGEDGGIGDLFTYCLEMFSLEFYPLLDICSSLCLASKESCSKVMEQLKNLNTFTEFWENIDERDIVATPEPNVWQLVKDRPIYGDSHITIPKGTLGIVLKQTDKNGSSIIQWKVTLNGWQVCLREIHLKLQEMNYSTAFIPSESIQRITSVAKLVNSILKTDIDMRFHLNHLINVLFSILQRCINNSSPSLEFISMCINIAATLSKNEMSDVWQQLAHIQLLPFMTYTPKNVSDMLSGMCMNAGILGQIIASKECVSGDYSVCLAFLDLVTNVSLTVVKEDDNFLACVIYILREVFSYFHKWYYNEHRQRILLGQKCLNLLHSLFSVEKDRLKALGKAQELSIYSLLHFEAGQTLLKIVCTGEEVIQQTILKQNSELGEQIASMIRLSLSVLNRLLLLRHKTTMSSKTEVTPLEAVLFSTPGHTNQPQVVLMVGHYAFQHYNPRLATLAVQLLKRFAKEFPMSLLACFGSEAEAIRDHFLARLSSVYGDIRFKVSVLEFLTVCVVQQPGLIEMFINVRRKSDKNKKEESKGCLECVKQILKEKKNESKTIYPKELLCAAVEFIHALWVGHQALAMEALKSDAQFWNLMCDSLMRDEFSHDNPGINAYIIRTLALEVFYSGKNRLNENLKSIFQDIHSKNSLLKWSKHIHLSKLMDNEQGDRDHSLDVSSIDFQDSFALLTAWRDFLLIVAVYEPLSVSSDCKKQILKDILEHLQEEMKSNNSRALILLSELFLMLSRHWQRELILLLNSDEMENPIFQILNEVAYNAETIHPREQLVVVSIAVFIVRLQSKTDLKIKNIKEWIVPCCQLLKKASILIHQPLDPKNIEGILKLPIVIVSLLNELIQVVKDWLPIIKNYSVIPLLVSLLIKSLKLNVGLQLAHGIITLFLSMGSDKKAAEALCNTGFMPEVTLILSDIDMAAYISEKRKNLGSQKPKLSRVDVYFAFLRFVTALLQTLGNYFLQDCWNFIGVHQEAMHITLVEMKNSFLREGIQDAILTCTFILQLSSHQHIWRLEHPRSLKMLLVDVCNCIYGTVAISCKPELLKYLVMHKKMLDSKPLKSLETESLLKRTTSEDDSQTPAEVQEIQQKLYELLAVTLTILTKYCPEMYETMSGHTIDYAQWQLLLHVSFSIPSLDRDGPLCFGTILACVNMCLKLLVKNEKTPSPRKTTDIPTLVNRHLLMYILEISLAILLSQSTIALTHPSLPARDKQLVRRELAAELNSMNITMNRYLRRGPLSPAGISTPSISPGTSSKSHPTEFPFMKLISNLVDKLFK